MFFRAQFGCNLLPSPETAFNATLAIIWFELVCAAAWQHLGVAHLTKRMKSNRVFLPVLAAVWFALAASAAPTDPLETGFLNPPDSAKPQTWWHWMNGNITKDGITADLEAMKQIGLGGATIVNVDCGIPRGPVNFMSPEWREDFKFAVQEANRLGLEMCVENCAGWSSSGGPWNTVTNAMQRVTTSEVRVTGPTNFSAPLPQPPTTLGFYRDIAVLAFPAPDAGGND